MLNFRITDVLSIVRGKRQFWILELFTATIQYNIHLYCQSKTILRDQLQYNCLNLLLGIRLIFHILFIYFSVLMCICLIETVRGRTDMQILIYNSILIHSFPLKFRQHIITNNITSKCKKCSSASFCGLLANTH